MLHTSTPRLANELGAFGKRLADDLGALGKVTPTRNPPTSNFIAFSAEAICELMPRNTYRIIILKPGTFERQ